ncbi:MAG: hypothetical protein HY079_01360 [Elusimicrobia bacterium]|nr:hypothetical protein [Elusimicrobiota bacterium]
MEKALDRKFGSDEASKEEMRGLMKSLEAEATADNTIREADQKRMVQPAPSGFEPEQADRKVQLKLSLEKNRIGINGSLRFHIDLTNVGRQAIDYEESSASIFRAGGLLDSRVMHFYVTYPDGHREKLIPAAAADKLHIHRPQEDRMFELPENLPAQDKEKWLVETQAAARAANHFQVHLDPGASLRSLGDDDSAAIPYRTLYCEQNFTTPGAYRLTVELDDRPPALTPDYIAMRLTPGITEAAIKKSHAERVKKSLGPVSASAAFQVEP